MVTIDIPHHNRQDCLIWLSEGQVIPVTLDHMFTERLFYSS